MTRLFIRNAASSFAVPKASWLVRLAFAPPLVLHLSSKRSVLTTVPRIKQGNDFPSERILGFGQVGFVLIAGATSQANIFKGSVPAFGLGINVVKAHRNTAIGFERSPSCDRRIDQSLIDRIWKL